MPDGDQPPSDDDRAARLAMLTARLAELTAPPAGPPVAGPSGSSGSGSPANGRPTRGPTAGSRSVIGGAADRRPPAAGGHPEDTPGDPAAVARQICLRLLTGAPRSRASLAEALRRKEIPDEVAVEVLDRLTDVGLIDDAAYADAFVATRHRDRGLGRTALQAELRRKGVESAVIAQAVTAVDGDAERDRARSLIARRVDASMAAGPVAARRRLIALLARRGYGPSVAVAVVDEALQDYGVPSMADDDGGSATG